MERKVSYYFCVAVVSGYRQSSNASLGRQRGRDSSRGCLSAISSSRGMRFLVFLLIVPTLGVLGRVDGRRWGTRHARLLRVGTGSGRKRLRASSQLKRRQIAKVDGGQGSVELRKAVESANWCLLRWCGRPRNQLAVQTVIGPLLLIDARAHAALLTGSYRRVVMRQIRRDRRGDGGMTCQSFVSAVYCTLTCNCVCARELL